MRKMNLILFLCLIISLGIKAQNVLVVQLTDQTEQNFDLGENGTVYFLEATTDSQGYINIVDNQNNSTTIFYEDIQKMYFASVMSIEEVENENQLLVYPNPAKDYIKIANASSEKSNIVIYSLDGKMLLQEEKFNNEQIDISLLEKGIYVLKVNNRTFKFSKI